MAITIDGTTGIASVDGSAGSPSVRGSDSNSGIVYAADTVAFSTAGSERVRVTSDGSVGIGTSSPDCNFHVYKGDSGGSTAAGSTVSIEHSDTATLQFLSPNNKYNAIRFGDNNDNGAGWIQYNHSDNSMQFGTNGSEEIRILSSGGITFNGDTATANALDDYEEGSWTPDPWDGTCGVSNARYVKIGGQVTIWALCDNFSDSSTNDQIGITGLPFAPVSNGVKGSAMYRYADDANKTTVYFSSTPRIHFYGGNTGGYTQLRHNEINNSNFEVYFMATYDAS